MILHPVSAMVNGRNMHILFAMQIGMEMAKKKNKEKYTPKKYKKD